MARARVRCMKAKIPKQQRRRVCVQRCGDPRYTWVDHIMSSTGENIMSQVTGGIASVFTSAWRWLCGNVEAPFEIQPIQPVEPVDGARLY